MFSLVCLLWLDDGVAAAYVTLYVHLVPYNFILHNKWFLSSSLRVEWLEIEDCKQKRHITLTLDQFVLL